MQSVPDIEKDLCRTYPEHRFFQSEQGRRELRTVLAAYSLHNPTIGYCQSMNFIAGMLVMFMTEEEAFWLLCAMMEKAYLPADNYAHSMVGTRTDQLVFKSLVETELPALSRRLEASGVQIQLVTVHWFLCAFVCTLPTESALRIWDWFFLDGQEVLFTTAIGILKLAESRLLQATCHFELHSIVRELGTDLHDEDALMAFLLESTKFTASGSMQNREQLSSPPPGGRKPSRLQSFLIRLEASQEAKEFHKRFTMHEIERLRGEFSKEVIE